MARRSRAILHVPGALLAGAQAAALLLSACPPAPQTVDAGASAASPDAGTASRTPRPPYPNMATAAWGQEVLEQMLRAAPAGEARNADVLDALHDVTPGAEQRAQEVALRAVRAAKTDAERGTAVALLAAAMALDPTPQGYRDRLTDAFGLAAFAGTLDAADAVGQGARALVAAAGGALAQADRLVEVVDGTPHVTGEARLFLALTRRLTGTGGLDAIVKELKETLTVRPRSLRARAALAEILLDLGFAEDVIAAVDAPDVKTAGPDGGRLPWFVALHGRALVLQGDVAGGVALLREAEGKLDEGRRGDALYWLGRSLTQTEAWATEVPPIVANLSTREGFMKEARTLEALVALLGGDANKAVELARPLTVGPARLPVDTDAAWLTVDACARAKSAACVEDIGRRAVALDGDAARLFRARALVLATDGDAGVDARIAPLEEQAQRLSPFADDPVATRRLKGARKAVARGARSLAKAALELHAKGCRVCLAVLTQTDSASDAAARALEALALPDSAAPPLADSDLVDVIEALGGVADDKTRAALDKLANDPRDFVQRAVAQARADHKDPDARKRRITGKDAPPPGAHDGPGAHGPGAHGPGAHGPGAPRRPPAPAGGAP